jgi:N-acetylglucosamine-6-phosphate deacetylase
VAGPLSRTRAGDVAISDGRIAAIAGGPGLASRPALVDAQVNGYAGVDVLSAGTDELVRLGKALLRDGVAAYQPTLITSPEADLLAALARIAEARERTEGARIVGVHLEGPFLSPKRTGTHPVEHLRETDPALLERLLAAEPVGTVTLAPELPAHSS